jgi:type VI protein secretion system component Hcp
MGSAFWRSWANGRANVRRRSRKGMRRWAPRLEVLEDRTLLSTSLGVTFDTGSGPLPELPVLSYSWGATNPTTVGSAGTGSGAGASKPSLQNFTLTLAPTSAEPGLWGHLTVGSHLNSATIDVSQVSPNGSVGVEYLSYTLTDVFITSFSTSDDGSDAPEDTIQLTFGKIAESYSPISSDGSLGAPNTAQFDQAAFTSGGAGSLATPASAPTPLGLTLVDGGVTEAELPVESYSWGATNSTTLGSAGSGGGAGASKPSLQNFTLTLSPTSAEPGLWGHLTAGRNLDSATIHVRQLPFGSETDYVTYTLTDVTITSFTTSDDGSDAPEDTIQLTFGKIAESYSPIDSDASLGAPNTAQYDQAAATSGGAGSLATSVSGTTPLGLTLVDGGVTEAELPVVSYSWGATNSTTVGSAGSGGGAGASKPSLQNFTLTLAPTSAEPGLWGHLTAGNDLDSATIDVRQVLPSGSAGVEYLTYTLTDVTITSFTTSEDDGGRPEDTIQLAFEEVTESDSPINSDGSLGAPNTAQYDQTAFTSGGAGSLATNASGTPQVGLAFVDGGVTEAELPVLSYSWGATNSTTVGSAGAGAGAGASKPSLQNFTLTLAPTSAEPGLWGHLTVGSHLDSATIDISQILPNGSLGIDYLTYTLTDVTITSFSTSDDGSDAPQDTIQLTFGNVAESYTPINPDGSLGAPNTAQYDASMNLNEGAGSLATSTPGTPAVGLAFVDGGVTEAELPVLSYSWGATNPTTVGSAGTGGGAGASRPSLQNFTLTLAPTSAEPGLWGHLTVGSQLDSATIDVRQSVSDLEPEYLIYTLTDVTITSFETSGEAGGGAPQDTIQLTFGKVAESYSPIDSDGSLGAPNTAQYDQAAATSGGAGSLATSTPGTPAVGLTFVDEGVTETELPVLSYSWGATNPTTQGTGSGASAAGKPSLQDFTLTLAPTSAEPGLWGHLTVGRILNPVTIDVRQVLPNGSVGAEYLTYTLTDVTITSFSTSDDGSDPPQDTIQLHFGSVAESYTPINPDGSLGAPNTAQYDVNTATSGGDGSLGPPAPITTTTALSASQSSTTYGQAVVYTAIVSPVAPSTQAPTGTVDFFDGATDISGPVTLMTVGGQQVALFTIATLDAAHSPHIITATYNGTAAFDDSTSGDLTQVVSPAALTITANNQTKVYGAALPALTASYSGFVNGDTTASLTTLPALATTATTASPVGGYAITASGAVDPNYTINYVSGSLTVTPAALTVTVNNTTNVYGAPLPAFTVLYSGFVGSDGPSVLGGQLTFSTTATATSAPGAYTVSASGLTDANYQIHYVSGTLTIVGNTYQIVPDALNPTKSVLLVGGSPNSETIVVAPGSQPDTLALIINGVKQDNIAAAAGTTFSRVRIYGGVGNDVLQVSPLLTLTSELYAGSGNDVLLGGGGNNILVGGTGHSILTGGLGRNILIGGSAGGDVLIGGLGDNLQIAGSTAWDQNTLALDSIMAEWASKDSYATRIADIMGTTSNPAFSQRQNGQYFLNASTVHVAASPDLLIGGLLSQDWFFADLTGPINQRDLLLDRYSNETVTEL